MLFFVMFKSSASLQSFLTKIVLVLVVKTSKDLYYLGRYYKVVETSYSVQTKLRSIANAIFLVKFYSVCEMWNPHCWWGRNTTLERIPFSSSWHGIPEVPSILFRCVVPLGGWCAVLWFASLFASLSLKRGLVSSVAKGGSPSRLSPRGLEVWRGGGGDTQTEGTETSLEVPYFGKKMFLRLQC